MHQILLLRKLDLQLTDKAPLRHIDHRHLGKILLQLKHNIKHELKE